MSIIEQARSEMDRTNFDADDKRVVIEIMTKFFGQWDSGGAVSVMAPVLQRLLAGKPLSPLTGADDEWSEVGEHDGAPVLQNLRCGTVFKQKRNGQVEAYNLDEPGRPTITFPYMPQEDRIPMPVMTIG